MSAKPFPRQPYIFVLSKASPVDGNQPATDAATIAFFAEEGAPPSIGSFIPSWKLFDRLNF